MRSDSECLGQKMAKIQDCEGASRPGTKQAWRGSLQSSPEFGCGACILVIFCPRHSHRGAWSCFLLLSRLPSSPMLLSAYFRQHLPQENIDLTYQPQKRQDQYSPVLPFRSSYFSCALHRKFGITSLHFSIPMMDLANSVVSNVVFLLSIFL